MIITIKTMQTMRNTTPSLARAMTKVILLLLLLLLVVVLGRQDGSILVVDKSPVPINKPYNYSILNYTVTT